jgi:DNA modification methylase
MTALSNNIHIGDAREVLATIPTDSVDCCVTSPPYFGLRDYGVTGQIGLEETPEAYIARLIEVFREVQRVLKPNGTLWLNLGDSYAGSGRGKGGVNQKTIQPRASFVGDRFSKPYKLDGYKNKDLIGIPWMMAFALRESGWFLRQEIIWHKPNPMPESVHDRCTKSHESLFLLSKSPRYYFNADAIKERAKYAEDNRGAGQCATQCTGKQVRSATNEMFGLSKRDRSRAHTLQLSHPIWSDLAFWQAVPKVVSYSTHSLAQAQQELLPVSWVATTSASN